MIDLRSPAGDQHITSDVGSPESFDSNETKLAATTSLGAPLVPDLDGSVAIITAQSGSLTAGGDLGQAVNPMLVHPPHARQDHRPKQAGHPAVLCLLGIDFGPTVLARR